MSGFPTTFAEAWDNHSFYHNLVLASKAIPPVQADTKKIVPANTVDVAPALPSPKPAAVLVSPVLPKSALPTDADDVHSSSVLLASPFNMLFSNISDPSIPNFIVQNNQLSETSMIRDYPSSFRNLPPTIRNKGIRFPPGKLPPDHALPDHSQVFVLDISTFSFLDGDPGLTLPVRPLPGAARFPPDMTAYFPVTDDPPELITSSSADHVLLHGSSAKSILLSVRHRRQCRTTLHQRPSRVRGGRYSVKIKTLFGLRWGVTTASGSTPNRCDLLTTIPTGPALPGPDPTCSP
jgi:hypothetical protein